MRTHERGKNQIQDSRQGTRQTSTLSLCLIEQFNVMLGTVPRHSIRYHLLSSYIFLVLRSTLSQRINPSSGGDTRFSHSVLDEMALSHTPGGVTKREDTGRRGREPGTGLTRSLTHSLSLSLLLSVLLSLFTCTAYCFWSANHVLVHLCVAALHLFGHPSNSRYYGWSPSSPKFDPELGRCARQTCSHWCLHVPASHLRRCAQRPTFVVGFKKNNCSTNSGTSCGWCSLESDSDF